MSNLCFRRASVVFVLCILAGAVAAQTPLKIPIKPTAEIQALLDAADKLPATQQSEAYAKAAESALKAKDYVGYDSAISALRNADLGLRKPDAARIYLQAQIDAAEKAGDVRWQATAIEVMGEFLDATGKSAAAVQLYERALAMRTRVNDLFGEAESLSDLGDAARTSRAEQALRYYNQLLPITRALGDRIGEATTLDNIGALCYGLHQMQKALDYYEQAWPTFKEAGNQAAEVLILNQIGLVYARLDQKRKALDYYERSLPIEKELQRRDQEATTLNNIGDVYLDLGNNQKALEYFDKASSIFKELGDKHGEAATLNNIGAIYSDLGRNQQALDYYARALRICKEERSREGEARSLENIGRVYSDLGQGQKALDYYAEALPIFSAAGDRDGEAITRSNIAAACIDLSDPAGALENFQHALVILRQIGDRLGEGRTLDNLGSTYGALGKFQEATLYFAKALPIQKELGDRFGEARTLSNMGESYAKARDFSRAVSYLQKALNIGQSISRDMASSAGVRRHAFKLIASVDANLGDVLVRQGKAADAEPFYRAAAKLDPSYKTTGKDPASNSVASGDPRPDLSGLPPGESASRGEDQGSARAIALNINTSLERGSSAGLSFKTGKRYALIVGTDAYASDSFRHLNNPVLDAKALGKALQDDYGFEPPTLLINKSKDEIWTALGELGKVEFKPADELVVFFAGHGDYDKLQRDGMIVCADTKPSKEDPSYRTYISDSALSRTLTHFTVRHILVILDVCFGGAFDKHFGEEAGDVPRGPAGADAGEAVLTRHVEATSRFLITSGGTEQVFDGPPGQHSKFMFTLLQVLATDAPFLTYEDLTGPLSHLDDPHPQAGYFGGCQPEGKFILVHK